MGLKSKQQYVESVRRLKAEAYMQGRRIGDVSKNGFTRMAVEGIGEIYSLSGEPQHSDLLTKIREDGARISAYCSIHRSSEDLVNRVRVARLICQKTGVCTASRCCGWDALNALWHTTFEIDTHRGTDYHVRLQRYAAMVQTKDLTCAGALTDPKGNRALKARHQPDKDVYVRVVEENPKGIIVRGAKSMIGGAIGSHEIIVIPGTSLSASEKEFAVAFAVPLNASGIVQVVDMQPGGERKLGNGFDKGNVSFGSSESLVVFDDVFVPKERVFMNGEFEYAAELVTKFVLLHRMTLGGCLAGCGDVLTGGAALLAEYNGLSRQLSDRLSEMAYLSEALYSQALGAAHESLATPSGAWFPDPLLANVTKISVTRLPYEIQKIAEDIGGGMIACMPSEFDLDSSRIGSLIEKYYRGAGGVGAENRLRAAKLVQSMVAGPGRLGSLCMHGGGSPAAAHMAIRQTADLESKKEMARRLAGIKEES
jgi:4-hydroxybutyryl-CoA dehydratase/vinylacetyl-CoA-Delta-isomerase